MIDLEKGILFEDSGKVLAWGSSREEAWQIDGAMHYNLKNDDTRIKWHENILNGVNCGILAYLPNSKTLDSVFMWMRIEEKYHLSDNALFHYLRFFNHLAIELGDPKIQKGFSKANTFHRQEAS